MPRRVVQHMRCDSNMRTDRKVQRMPTDFDLVWRYVRLVDAKPDYGDRHRREGRPHRRDRAAGGED